MQSYKRVPLVQKQPKFQDALETKENKALTITRTLIPGVSIKNCNVKAVSVKGRKHADSVLYLHSVLRDEFVRHSSAEVEMSRSLLQYIAFSLLKEDDSTSGAEELDPSSSRPIASDITFK